MTASVVPTASVLLVDADIDRRLDMHAFLKSAGYEVAVAIPGEEALRACIRWSPAVIVLDATTDRELAVAMHQRLRAVPPGAAAVMVWSVVAEDEEDMRAQAVVLGVDDCLPWPVSRSELRWRVRSLLQWKQRAVRTSDALAQIKVGELLKLQRRREQTLALLIHDMKNPLSGVISNVEYLRSSLSDDSTTDPELPGCVQDILQAARRLYRMVQSMLDVSQSEDGVLIPEPRRIGVGELLGAAEASCRGRLRDKAIELALRAPAQALELYVDPDMSVRLLANLLDNAIAATPSRGRIELVASEQQDFIELRVRDFGRGLAPAERARLAGSSSPADSRNAPARRGLGLHACRVLAEAHGGTIGVEDHEGQGATVCVRLPRPA